MAHSEIKTRSLEESAVKTAKLDDLAVSNAKLGTDISAAKLTAGTLPDARFPATLPAISGANLTNLTLGGPTIASLTPDVVEIHQRQSCLQALILFQFLKWKQLIRVELLWQQIQ